MAPRGAGPAGYRVPLKLTRMEYSELDAQTNSVLRRGPPNVKLATISGKRRHQPG